MGRKGVDCGCGAREDLYDRIAALKQRIEVLETEINQVESEFPGVLGDVRDAKDAAVAAAASADTSAAAAEASAEIAEGFGERLGAVEDGVLEVNQYAEAIGDDVSALDTEIHTTKPYVTTNTNQNITGTKTFSKNACVVQIDHTNVGSGHIAKFQAGTLGNTQWADYLSVKGNDENNIIQRRTDMGPDGIADVLYMKTPSNVQKRALSAQVSDDSSKNYILGMTPTDPNVSASALVTKGWCANTSGLNNLMHTDSDEFVSGIKVFRNLVTRIMPRNAADSAIMQLFKFYSADGIDIATLQIAQSSTGYREIQFKIRKQDDTYKTITVGNNS